MKKIGIITLFGYTNYGNRLQMYAVQKVYKTIGFDSEIIKFKQEAILKDSLWRDGRWWNTYVYSILANDY